MQHLWQFATRSLWARKLRASLTATAVACGVAMMLGLGVAYNTAELRIRAVANILAGPAQVQIRPHHAALMSQEVVKIATTTPGVAVVSPLLRATVRGAQGMKSCPLIALGLDPEADGHIRNYPVARGQGLVALRPTAQDTLPPVLLLSYAAGKLDADVRDEVAIGFASRSRVFVVKGVLLDDTFPIYLDGPTVVMRLEDLQDLTNLRGQISEINLALQPNVDPASIIDRLSQMAGPQTYVSGREGVMEAVSSNLTVARLLARMLSIVTLFVGVFTVYNALGMTVVERARELAVLRALGASRRQIFMIILTEALIIGCLGTAIGLALGRLVGQAALQLASGHAVPCVVSRQALAVSAAAGVLGTLVAGLFPAWRAATLAPVDVMRPCASDSNVGWARPTSVVGLTLVATSVFILHGPLPPSWKVYGFCYIGLMAFMVGVAVLAPGVIRRAVSGALPWAMTLCNAPLTLATANVGRTTVRTGLAACALMVGIGFIIDISGSVGSVIRDWEESIVALREADLVATPRTPAQATLDPGVFQVDGVSQVSGAKMVLTEMVLPFPALRRPLGLGRVLFTAVEPRTFSSLSNLSFEGCTRDEAFAALERGGEVVVSADFARVTGARPGGRLLLRGVSGSVDFRIAGLVRDPRLAMVKDWHHEVDYRGLVGSLVVFGSLGDARRYFGVSGLDVIFIKFRHDADGEALEKKLRELARRNGWRAVNLRRRAEMFFAECRRKVGYINAVLIVAVLVGALSVVNTIAMNVTERGREMAALRAVGATRWQVMWSVLTESGIIGLTGAVLGAIMGIFLIHACLVIARAAMGFHIPFLLPFRVMAACGMGAVALSLIAGLAPAFRMAWSNIAEAIRTE